MSLNVPVVLPDFGPLHPPCLICHGKGSGMHYGVNTCNACKGFFQRCLTRKVGCDLKCKYNGACLIDQGDTATLRKKHCPACRFRKCLKVGMTKNGCHAGRHTSEKRSQVIEEVKRLELQAKLNKDGTLVAPKEHERNMDDLVNLLTNTRLQAIPNTSKRLENDIDNEKKFLKSLRLEEDVYGKRHLLPRSESKRICSETGLDVDGRKDMVEKLLRNMDRGIKDMLAFVECIPGFETLPQRDKMKLIKYSSAEVGMFQTSHFYNLTDNVISHAYDSDLVIRLEDILMFDNEDYPKQCVIDGFKKKLKIVQDMELTVEEAAMATALCFMIPGVNIPLCSQKIVYNSAEYLLEVLEREICKNHDPGSHILAKIILLVYDLRAYEHHQDKAIDNFVQDALEVGVAEYLVALYDCVHR